MEIPATRGRARPRSRRKRERRLRALSAPERPVEDKAPLVPAHCAALGLLALWKAKPEPGTHTLVARAKVYACTPVHSAFFLQL